MAITETIKFDSTASQVANFSFNSELVNFTGTQATLRNLHADTLFHLSFDDSFSFDINDSTATISADPSQVSISGGKLDMTVSGLSSYLRFSVSAAVNDLPGKTGAWRGKYTPNFTGSPSSTKQFFSLQSTVDNNNKMSFYCDTTSKLKLIVHNTAGTVFINSGSLGTISFASGVEQEVELNWDFSEGLTNVNVGGSPTTATITTKGSRDGNVSFYTLGNDATFSLEANNYLDDVTLFTSVQHTGSYSVFTGTVPTTKPGYPDNNPLIRYTPTNGVRGISAFSASSVTVPTGTNLTYVFTVDGTDKYFDGSSWADSNGSSQANSESVFATNVTALSFDPSGNQLTLGVYVNSTGSSTPALGTVTYSYDFIASAVSEPNMCVVYGYEDFPEGDPISNMTVRVKNKTAFYHGDLYVGRQEIDVTVSALNGAGYWSVELYETETVSQTYVFEKIYTKDNGTQVTDKFDSITVPDQKSANFKDIS